MASAATCLAGTPSAGPVTTILVHGFSTTEKGVWVQAMAEAIVARGGVGGSIYRYTESTAAWTYVAAPGVDGSNDNIVLIFNWVPESDAPDNGPNWNYAQAAGDVLYAALRDPMFAGAPPSPPASLVQDRWLHFIGHSRGTCVNSETILRLAREGIAVDHMTTLDPHPVNGTLDSPFNFNWNDPTPARWSNVAFADNYWRADGGGFNALDFDGIPIAGAFNTELNDAALNCCAYSMAHSDVHLWLHGTIDLAPAPCDGEQCINATMRSTWWPEGYTQRGWFYSRLGGGAALRPPVGTATTPPLQPFIVNGDFNNATYAGWSFHGGTVGGQILNSGGATFARIGAGIGTSPLVRHNRLFVPAGASAIELDSRITAGAGAGGETLRLTLTDQSNQATIVANDPIPAAPGGWITDRQFTIPQGLVRNRTYTLTLAVVSSGVPAAVVDLDNIGLVVLPLTPGDIDQNGCVDVNDLLAVITTWGACPAAPEWCDADADHSGSVDVNDLLTVITHWGCG